MRMTKIAAAFMLIMAAPMAIAEDASDAVRKEIVGITQELMDALVPGKSEVWQRYLVDDALITDEFGRRQTKQETIDGMHPFPAGVSGSIELRDARVHVYGDTAVLDCEEYETEVFFGQKFVVRYMAMNTYVRRDGAWKVIAMEDVTLPTPPPALDVKGIKSADYIGSYRISPERAWEVAAENGTLVWRTKAGRPSHALDAVAKDVFMGGDDEKNLMIFRRDEKGNVVELVERRKFNDLHLRREKSGG
jgi:hypothetical protein